MNRKEIKIAKSLLKIAKEILNEEVNAGYDIHHPFSFTKSSQEKNKIMDAIKKGEDADGVIMKGTQKKVEPILIRGDKFYPCVIEDGKILCPPNLQSCCDDIVKAIKSEVEEGSTYIGQDSWSHNNTYGFSPCWDQPGKPIWVNEVEIPGKGKIKVIWDIK